MFCILKYKLYLCTPAKYARSRNQLNCNDFYVIIGNAAMFNFKTLIKTNAWINWKKNRNDFRFRCKW